MRMKNPSHPGEFIRTEVIEHFGLSVTKGAEILGVGRQALSSLLNGRSSLSPEMATRVEKAFGVSRELLLRMQLAYDLAHIRTIEDKISVTKYNPQVM